MRGQGIKPILILLLSLFVGPVWADGGLSVQVDRQHLTLGDSFELTLTAEGDVPGEPDWGPLRQDLEVLGQTQSEITRIINGRVSHRRQWRLRLAPKRAGRLTIPAIQIGRAHSLPVTIEVTEAAPSTGSSPIQTQGTPPQILVTAEAETTSPYVQQPIEYRVKVYYQQTPHRATLSEPEAEGAWIQRLGEDRQSEEIYQGRAYRVIERRYRLIPQRSGRITIRPPQLEAWIPGPSRDPFSDLDRLFGQLVPDLSALSQPSQRISGRAPEIILQVRPQPPGAKGQWLPATSVQLTEEWTPDPPLGRVGEPITRTLTLTAEGITAAQLPELDLGPIAGLKVYPDRPQAEDLEQGPRPAAVKTFRFALVPTQPGVLTLPEIRIHWWDTQADHARVAVIPGRSLQVVGTALGQPDGGQAAGETGQGSADQVQDRQATGQTPDLEKHPPRQGAGAGIWPWVSLLLGLGWLATLWIWRRERRRSGEPAGNGGAPAAVYRQGRVISNPSSATEQERQKAFARARQSIHTACLAHDPRAARAALLEWGRLRWPDRPPIGLHDLAERLDHPEIRPLLQAIDAAIYAPPARSWDGGLVWEQLAPHLGPPAEPDQARNPPLPRLYPESGG